MKKIIAFMLILLLTATLFCGCGGNSTVSNQSNGSSQTGESLVGVWATDNKSSLVGKEAYRVLPKCLELKSDGTGDTDFFDINYWSESITWVAENGKLTITSEAFKRTYDYSINGSTLTLSIGEDYKAELERR